MSTHHALLTASLLSVTATAVLAQPVAPSDPQQASVTQGRVAQYSLTPHGDVDGVILEDGTQVHLPPHLGPQLVQAVKAGDAVTIRGARAQMIPLVQALSITDASGQTIVDTGPSSGPLQPPAIAYQWLSVQGHVREPLYGPRGDLDGALLEDGTPIHLPPHLALSVEQDLQAGKTLVAQGYGVTGAYGRSLDAQRLGEGSTQLVQLGPPEPRDRGGPSAAWRAPPPPVPNAVVAPPPVGQNP